MTYKTLIAIAALTLSGCAGFPFLNDFDDSHFADAEENPGYRQLASQDDYDPYGDDLSDARAETEEAMRLEINEALKHQDIVMGMPMEDVVRAWGDPADVQVAGDPYNGNQKWTYFSGLSSTWSLKSGRIVYFESGRVVGWDRQ